MLIEKCIPIVIYENSFSSQKSCDALAKIKNLMLRDVLFSWDHGLEFHF